MFNEQFPELNKSSLENALRFARITMESAERLVKLQLETAKQAIEENAKNTKALSEVKDLQEVVALRTKLAEAGVEKALSYSRNVYEVASQAQAELTKLFEESLSAYTKDLVSAIEKTSKSAPAGSDLAVAALKSTVAATQAAVDSMTKAARQVAELADTGVKAAHSATSSAVKGGSKKNH
ncbi:MAG TPA: phasin family protein [Burkholderiales bacterium]|nr:phasin family protein [Burkholderiales bacterium]